MAPLRALSFGLMHARKVIQWPLFMWFRSNGPRLVDMCGWVPPALQSWSKVQKQNLNKKTFTQGRFEICFCCCEIAQTALNK
eukprot:6168021-Amphidinium_carterae.1